MSLVLGWHNECDDFPLPEGMIDKLRQILAKAAELEGISVGEVALTFVDDEAIRELNQEFRGVDQATDVLSFPLEMVEDEELEVVYELDESETEDVLPPQLLGDIVISLPCAKEQSEQYAHSLEREIGFLFIHGFLHLLGFDHEDEQSEQEMFTRQEQILQEAGLVR